MRATLFCAALMTFALFIAVTADSAHAVVVEVGFQNDPDCCDNLLVPKVVDELGRGVVNGPPQAGFFKRFLSGRI